MKVSAMLGRSSIGIGLRQPHYRDVFDRLPSIDFVEVHSENFFLDGGASMDVLTRARSQYAVSLHGVGLSLGSVDEFSEHHLAKLKRLVDRIEPALVSEHCSWGSFGGTHFNDLLPLPLTIEALKLMANRIEHTQEVLGRSILIENVSSYFSYLHEDMTETSFLGSLARTTGCKILLDVNNLYVNSVNSGFDPYTALGDLPSEAIGEIHLAGHHTGAECLIDDHGSRISVEVWDLYRDACRRFGPRPTLVEWDCDLPEIDVLLAEAGHANEISRTTY